MPEVKATWRGHQIYMVDDFSASGWVKIAFVDPASFFTGTGACWVSEDDIVLEACNDD